MSVVFINYRRDDSAAYAGRICDRLANHFDRENCFMDIDHFAPGEDFKRVILEKLSALQVAIVLIGKQWLNIMDDNGRRLLGRTYKANKGVADTQNNFNNGACPTVLCIDAQKMGRIKPSIYNSFERCAPLAPHAPLKIWRVGLDNKNMTYSFLLRNGALQRNYALQIYINRSVCLLMSVE
jgi:hypothetical protein